MRAAIYHRVSTLDQDATAARDELRQVARGRGMLVVDEIEETGSGARNDRPGLARVMELAKRGKVDAVLVWKLDRFGRSALDLLANIDSLNKVGVRFVATSQMLEVAPDGNAISKLILHVMSGVAEFERELVRERTRLGMSKARAAGKHLGRPRVAVDVERARELRGAGWSYARIGDELGISSDSVKRGLAAAAGAHAAGDVGADAAAAAAARVGAGAAPRGG